MFDNEGNPLPHDTVDEGTTGQMDIVDEGITGQMEGMNAYNHVKEEVTVEGASDLDKLNNLREQGFLDDEELTLARAKLLKENDGNYLKAEDTGKGMMQMLDEPGEGESSEEESAEEDDYVNLGDDPIYLCIENGCENEVAAGELLRPLQHRGKGPCRYAGDDGGDE